MNNFEIKTVEFVRGIVGTNDILEDPTPQIAFVGRSNVGKSSLINSLVGRNDLARSSSKPGKTTEINFFLVNDAYYFVDLPGYGFAKISQKQREKLRKLIIWYLGYGEVKPKKVVLIIDANVGLKPFDLEMIDLLKKEGHDFLIVANKVDKIKSSKLEKQKREILSQVGQDFELVFYSSKTGKGKNDVLKGIFG
ncbi:MAG: ribosome biogenesis GTP-binding protein YihA/YsxC [Candidatus Moranbacteria bacterium]|nr:ribosome biogenesis GTP-binding protein YihA/YsxC [Candidatus Moranbacteria bacterium]